MKGKPEITPLIRGRRTPVDPEAVAIEILGRLAADPERLGRFLALTGIAPQAVRGAAAQPGFLAAVLDHVASDEQLLLAVAAEIGLDPSRIAEAQARLSPEPGWEP
jgi:hypothetical protein